MTNRPYEKYPSEGAQGVIAAFEEAFVRWANDGYPDGNWVHKTPFYRSTTNDAIVISNGYSISKHYAGCPQDPFSFFVPRLAKAEREQLEAYARSVGLTFLSRDGGFVVCFSGLLKASGMNRAVAAMQEKIKSVIPLAQKFYELPLLEEITKRALGSRWHADAWWQGVFTMNGVHFEQEYDKDGYTYRVSDGFGFGEFGYRPLQSEEELIAFALASFCRYQFFVQPKELEMEYLKWSCFIKDGKLREHPSYHKPQPKKEEPPKPQMKDFFE